MPELLPAQLPRSAHLVPHVDQFFGVWAMEPRRFQQHKARAERLDLHVHLQSRETRPLAYDDDYDDRPRDRKGYSVVNGGTAVIELSGPLLKHADSFSGGTSTVLARKAIRQAANDDSITSILIHIDSPGGTVAGTKDLADDVAKAAAVKPVEAYIEDLGASAAYWIAAACSKVWCNDMAEVGSIGTYMAVADFSEWAANEGIKVHLITTGPYKGAGVEGVAITDDQLAHWQGLVDDLNAHFLQAVSAGRGLSLAAVREVADGRVHIAKTAQKLGLVDGIKTLDDVLAGLSRRKSPHPARSRAVLDAPIPTAAEPALESPGAATPGLPAAFDPPHSESPPAALGGIPSPTPAASEPAMPDTTTATTTAPEPKSHGYHSLLEACAGCDPANSGDDARFLCEQLGRKATADQAAKAWMQTLKARSDAREQELAAERKKAAEAAAQQPSQSAAGGIDPVRATEPQRGTGADDPAAEWRAAVDEEAKRFGGDRVKAIKAVDRKHPELRQQMLAAANA